MRVFVTGASGFVGSAVVQELLSHGHQVRGLSRSDKSAQAIAAAGAEVFRGSLDDPNSLTRGTTGVDGVLHLAFDHNYADYGQAAEADRTAILALGRALAGTAKPLVVTSGLAGLAQGRPGTELDTPAPSIRFSEAAADELLSQGLKVIVLRLAASVHDKGDNGFVPAFIQLAREKGQAAYLNDGQQHWPAVHRLDAARLYRLALEQGKAGARYHAVGDEGIPFRDIAEEIGRRLDMPTVSLSANEAQGYFGLLATFASRDRAATAELTRQRLGWQPTQPGLLADMDANYFG